MPLDNDEPHRLNQQERSKAKEVDELLNASRHEIFIEDITKGKNWPQILVIFVTCLTSFTLGAQSNWTSPFIVKISEDKVNYNISEAEASHFATIHPLGSLICSIFLPILNDRLGRKYTVLLIAAPQLLFWILTAVAKSVYIFYLARVFSGISKALHFESVPMYLGEITTPAVRGKWVNVPFYMGVGQFFINLIGQNFSVWHTSMISSSCLILFILIMPFMPESPYYCAMKNKEAKGKRALRFLRGNLNVEKEYARIKVDVARQMSEHGKWKDLFLIKSNRLAIIAMVFLRVSQQFSGITVFQSYTQFIFEKSGQHVNPGMATLIIVGLYMCMTFISGYIVEMFGRKKAFMFSMLGCAVMLLLESVYFYLEQNTSLDLKPMKWFPLIGMVLYTIFSSCGVSTVPTLMLGELFSSNFKAKGLRLNVIVMGIFLFINNGLFYILVSRFGIFSPFLFFGVVSIISTVLSIYIIPETKGKTLRRNTGRS